VPDRLAFRERVALFLKAHPNEWIPATQFEAIGGRQAWRTRLAECRKVYSMDIENRCRRIQTADGFYTLSEYRLKVPEGQAALF
jgi:hypothetical protein